MQQVYAVIMAGGVGTRFWPLSTPQRPKQLLPLAHREIPLLREAALRLLPMVDWEHILVATSESLRTAVQDLLCENIGRNTAPCIAWAAMHVAKSDPDALLLVTPADHTISNDQAFQHALNQGLQVAQQGTLVTLGIPPTRAHTGYGYIEVGKSINAEVYQVNRFVEKPNQSTAETLLAQGNYWWNSGMFVFHTQAILSALQTHLPQWHQALAPIMQTPSVDAETAWIAKVYPDLDPISIDYGVLEKVDDMAVVRSSFSWSDLGSWENAWELAAKDAQGNVSRGHVCAIDSQGCYLRADASKPIALLGVKDLIVVDTPRALLIVPRERSQEIRQLVSQVSSEENKL